MGETATSEHRARGQVEEAGDEGRGGERNRQPEDDADALAHGRAAFGEGKAEAGENDGDDADGLGHRTGQRILHRLERGLPRHGRAAGRTGEGWGGEDQGRNDQHEVAGGGAHKTMGASPAGAGHGSLQVRSGIRGPPNLTLRLARVKCRYYYFGASCAFISVLVFAAASPARAPPGRTSQSSWPIRSDWDAGVSICNSAAA